MRYRGTRFPIRRGEYVLGRSPYCSVVVSNALASRQHCSIRLTSEGLSVTDLDSRNGTTVNGERLTGPRVLRAGDVIRIGSDSIEILLADSNARAAGTMRDADLRQNTQPRVERSDIPALEGLETLASAFDDDSSTVTDQNAIRLIAELVEATSSLPNRQEKITPLMQSIAVLVEARLQRGARFSLRDAERLLLAARTMDSWFSDQRLSGWLLDLEKVLESSQ